MKKWFKFFHLSFFSHKIAKEGAKRSYANFLLAFILSLIFLWSGFMGGDMLPFSSHYKNSPDFRATVYSVFANADTDKRINAEIENGILKVKNNNGEYIEDLLINTFEIDVDKQNYSVNGYNVVVDCRPADTPAEIEAYCVSNDGQNLIISYEEYLSLDDVLKLKFDFKLKYTGNALQLNDEIVEGYRTYVDALSDDNKITTENLANELATGQITENEYNRAIYELYFVNYYPEITDYEETSKVPLLRNYYYHQYLSQGVTNYLLVFDDYMAGSFETKSGINVSFYGFYSNLKSGALIGESDTQEEATGLIDKFIKSSFSEIWFLNAYIYAMNIFAFIPFIVLMPMVVTLMAYSIFKLRGVESIKSFGAVFKIVGSFVWFSSIAAALITVIMAFFVQRNMLNTLPLILFFVVLAIRSIVFVIKERKLYIQQLEQQEAERTEG